MIEIAVRSLIKDLAAGSCFFLRAPDQQKGRFIIITREDAENWPTADGAIDFSPVYLRIDAYAETYAGAKRLFSDIKAFLNGFMGDVQFLVEADGDAPSQDLKIHISSCNLQNDFDLLDQTDKPVLYRHAATYLIIHTKEETIND